MEDFGQKSEGEMMRASQVWGGGRQQQAKVSRWLLGLFSGSAVEVMPSQALLAKS
jgi:hypothetical protein